MTDDETTLGERIKAARKAAGLTQQDIASYFGINRVSVTQWEKDTTRPDPSRLMKLAEFLQTTAEWLLDGRGNQNAPGLGRSTAKPTVDLEDIPADAVFTSGEQKRYQGAHDVEKLGVVAGGDDGDFHFNGEVIEHVARPRGLIGRAGVFSLEVISDSMYPAYRKGDPIYCDRTEPQPGDDIVIETFAEEGEKNGKSYVKRLVRRTKAQLIVEQFNPPSELTFDRYAVKHVWRVVPVRELHGS
ncbi:helix-turn-helix domain-containing protein [Mesorhizobium sp. RP14(2022)]|uniref:Helix-turn-helix domain-containing protein n=1 Tax=Mesorhizobium liriopis TaxID=2953882 RepID=A0ABT1C882_9HYPH|nr:helix-turn-helix domain-containing protein [Mesorhizobium liriopis]MCO6050878.1 helix-turn-helix domain-containing protein [Mesorhizobium liriopis]